MNSRLITVAALLGCALSAQAAVTVFADNFDATDKAVNTTPAGWSIGNGGTVDVIGTGLYDYMPGSGHYVDLDGSTNAPGLLEISLLLNAGIAYTANFDLAGNQLNGTAESVAAAFGAVGGTYSLAQDAGWTSFALTFTPDTTGSYTLSFLNNGGDNMGMLLDNISVTAVPEPQSWALMAAGLLALGATSRRRTRR